MTENCRYELTYIDVAGRHRKDEALSTLDRSMAVEALVSVKSPHAVELWQGSKLIASRKPNEPPVFATEWSFELRKLRQHVVRRRADLLKNLLPLRLQRKVRAAA